MASTLATEQGIILGFELEQDKIKMPIYAYQCAECGHQDEHLQKITADPLTECPACKAASYQKRVTAAGFQLKGSGWYQTDFKGGASASRTDSSGTS